MADNPRKVFIVSHTHWDREWYLTFHRFRVNLVRAVDRVLDVLENDDAFEHFLLDGQAVILEDYLEARPGHRGRIASLVAGGALSVGPWYVLPDEFLVSAEATVRNLLIGHRVGAAFGDVQKVGYMPDSFGHIAQMPQILRRAGIDTFVFTRGMGDELDDVGHEFLWRAPDGSEVLAVNQCDGYCAAGGLGFEELWHAHTRREVDVGRAVEKVRALFEKQARHSNGGVRLLSNGCDHFPPQQDFARILAALREAFPETAFVHGSLAGYLGAVKREGIATRVFEGELTRGRRHHILSGVWSARMPLKQWNHRAQTLLADYLEPLAAYAHFALGQGYPGGLIGQAWKLLLRNHPHDSICGCSTDDVHRDMEPRFRGVADTAEQELARSLEEAAPTFARNPEGDRDTILLVANPLPVRRREVVERLVPLQALGYDLERLRLVDESGRVVPVRIVERWCVERFWGVDYRLELFSERQLETFRGYLDDFGARILKSDDERDVHDTFLRVQFVADLPALGHAIFRLTDGIGGEVSPAPTDPVRAAGDVLENRFHRIRLHGNGVMDIEDKRSGLVYEGLHVLEDTEDVGDEYDYSPCVETSTVSSREVEGTVSVVAETGLVGCLEARFVLDVPGGIDPDRKRRSSETVPCPVRTRVTVQHGSPVIAVETVVENSARDHRLRVLFPTGIASNTLVSDGHFQIHHRPVRPPSGEGWVQPPSGTHPQQEFSLVQDGNKGLAVLSRGLPEIEAVPGPTGEVTLALTLLRCVGWLSRDDFPTRRFQNAGPTIPTPDAQCPGAHRFEYALVPFAGDYVAADIKGISRRYQVPPVAIQGVEDGHAPGTSLFEKTSAATTVSAVKRSEERDSLLIRLYNPTRAPADEELRFSRDIGGAWHTNLLEERGEEMTRSAPRTLSFTVAPHEIVTVEVSLA